MRLGVVLAGGRSQRMGQDKAQLELSPGHTLQHEMVAALTPMCDRVVVSGKEIDDRFGDYRGPLAGIQAAWSAYPEFSELLVVPIDMPGLSTFPWASYFSSALAPQSYYQQGSLFPILLRDRQSVMTLLDEWLAAIDGPRSIKHLLKSLNSIEINLTSDSEILNNLNTQHDWQQFLERRKRHEQSRSQII